MRIGCYRERAQLADVSILEIGQTEVPLEEVLSEGLADPRTLLRAELAPVDVPGAGPPPDRPPIPTADSRNPPAAGQAAPGSEDGPRAAWPLTVKLHPEDSKSAVVTEGFLVAPGAARLARFLEQHWVAQDPPRRRLDVLVRSLQTGDLDPTAFLRAVEQEFSPPPGEVSRFARREGFEDALRTGILTEEALEEALTRRQDALGPHYLLSASAHPDADNRVLAVVAPIPRRLAGGPVLPGWAFITPSRDNAGFGVWDGRRYRVVRGLEDIPAGLLQLLETDGSALPLEPTRLLPLGDLAVRFVLRVPTRQEVAHLSPDHLSPRRDALARPAFLTDARAAVPLPSDGQAVPVIDDPAEALAVLTRVTGHGAYLPTLPPATLAETPLRGPHRPYPWILGVWPA